MNFTEKINCIVFLNQANIYIFPDICIIIFLSIYILITLYIINLCTQPCIESCARQISGISLSVPWLTAFLDKGGFKGYFSTLLDHRWAPVVGVPPPPPPPPKKSEEQGSSNLHILYLHLQYFPEICPISP